MKKLAQLSFILSLFFNSFGLSGQSLLINSANKSYKKFHYIRAMELYEKVISSDSSNKEVLIKLSDCYEKIQDTRNQERILRRLSLINGLTPDLNLKFAMVLAENGNYNESAKLYALLTDNKAVQYSNAYKNLSKFYQDSANFKIYDLGDLNSSQSDFSPVYFKNGIVFTSARCHLKAHHKSFAWNNSPFLNLYFVDTASIRKKIFHTNISEDYVSENHIFHASAVHDFWHSDVTETTPNDTRTLGNHTPENYHSAFENKGIKLYGKKINSKYHEGSACFSSDKKTIYFTRNNYINKKAKKSYDGIYKLKIYSATMDSDSTWSNIKDFSYNNENYSVGHPTISINNKVMFFVSDMPGGYGGKDIYFCKWENETWSKPENMGAKVNTPDNEMFPYIASDSVLYFSTEGFPGLGGMDIFYLDLKNSDAKSENLGYPINSKKDDFGFIINENNSYGYFSSNRKNETHDDDIYAFKISYNPKIKGKIVDSFSKKRIVNAKVSVKSLDGILIDSATTDQNGEYIISALKPNNEYKIFVEKPGFYSDSLLIKTIIKSIKDSIVINFDINRSSLKLEGYVITSDTKEPLSNIPVELYDNCTKTTKIVYTDSKGYYSLIIKPNCCYVISTVLPNCGDLCTKTDATQIDKDVYRLDLSVLCKGDIIKIDNIYYDIDKWFIRPEAAKELDKILTLFKEYPELKVELRSHTDCRMSKKFNQILSDKRAKAAADYLVSKGVKRSQIIGKGYGETKLVNNCKCEGNVVSKPCSEIEHQLNRRTEILILGVGTYSEEKHKFKVHSLCHE